MSVDLPEPATAPSVPGDDIDVPGLPDTALRSALEFAVGIAAAGQKLRPPLAYPPGLKAYLKFSRLDRASLRAVRRAVAGDELFRGRLGEVANSELVDEMGIAWLQRPQGWHERVRALHAAAIEEAETLSTEAALRKAERRRDAAEQAAARVSAELVASHDSVAREQARRERAEDAAAAATSQLTSVRTEVEALRRELDKAKRRVETECGRAERAEQAVVEVTAQLRAVEALRDQILAQRAAGEPADSAQESSAAGSGISPVPAATPDADDAIALNRAVAQALQQAAAATREAANALAAAGEALDGLPSSTNRPNPSSADSVRQDTARGEAGRAGSVRQDFAGVRPLRPKPSSRKPIAIPGGVYGDSLAAADHLLRTPRAAVIVDGYNVAKLGWPTMGLLDQRELCIEMLEDLARRIGADIRVVFDGADVVGASARRRLIRVQYSPPGVIADDVIRAEVRALPATTPVVVVTNDQAIVNDVRAEGANSVSSDMLLLVGGRTPSR